MKNELNSGLKIVVIVMKQTEKKAKKTNWWALKLYISGILILSYEVLSEDRDSWKKLRSLEKMTSKLCWEDVNDYTQEAQVEDDKMFVSIISIFS